MPVLSRCPLCRGVMPDTRGGEARCPRCGELVLPALRKLCAGCGADVTRDRRVRDGAGGGDYYCHTCWAARPADQGEFVGFLCNTCGLACGSDQVYPDGDEVVCHECLAARAGDNPDALLAAAEDAVGTKAPAYAAAAGAGRKSAVPWALISFGIAVLVVLVVTLLIVSVR